MNALVINGRTIGPGNPVYIIAELSANHGGKFEQAAAIVRAAKAAGADAIKLQTYTADTMTLDSDEPAFAVGAGTPWAGRRLHELYREAHTPWEWQPRLQRLAAEIGLDCFSTPFDATAVDFLESLGMPAHKIASFELVDLELVRKVARTGKPTILSTGMSSFEEISDAVRAFREAGGQAIALLKCTSAYPAPAGEMNLRTLPRLAQAFDAPAGLSDHTLGIAVPAAAVALGACIIEKHLTLRRADGGPDSAFSLEPAEFKAMVDSVRTVEQALGAASFGPAASEEASRVFRRSLFVVAPVRQGERLTERNVRCIRPGSGLHPRHLPAVLGSLAARDLSPGTPLGWDLVTPPRR